VFGHSGFPLDPAVIDSEPGLVNAEPTGEGWLFKMKIGDPTEMEGADGAMPRAVNTMETRCRVRDLNSRPTVYKTAALPLS
jgi:glycine cleavage system H protein